MDKIAQLIVLAKQTYNGEIHPRNILAVEFQVILRKLCFWFNEDDILKATFFEKFLTYFWIILYLPYWCGIVSYLIFHGKEVDFVHSSSAFSWALGGIIAIFRVLELVKNRARISRYMVEISERVQESKNKLIDKSLLKEWNIVYFWVAATISVSLSCVVLWSILTTIYSLYTGRTFFPLTMPYPPQEAYSILWWVEVILQNNGYLYSGTFYTLCDGLLIDGLLQVAFLHKALYQEILTLKGSDPLHLIKLQKICVEMAELERLCHGMIDYCWGVMFLVGSLGYIILGVSAISITLSMDKGLGAVFQVLFYPVFVLGVLILWSIVGTYFEESLQKQNEVIFATDWFEMSQPARKILQILMLKGQQTRHIHAMPFYIINREYFASMIKKTYTIYTLFRNIYFST